MLLQFLFYVCLLTMLYVRFFLVFYSLKMRETLKVENRCCLRTLILFMCVFSLIFFSYFIFTFSFFPRFLCSKIQQPPTTTTVILISFLLRILSSLLALVCLLVFPICCRSIIYTYIYNMLLCFQVGRLVVGIVWNTIFLCGCF